MTIFLAILFWWAVSIAITAPVALVANKNRIGHVEEHVSYNSATYRHYDVPDKMVRQWKQGDALWVSTVPGLNIAQAFYLTGDYLSNRAEYQVNKKVFDAVNDERLAARLEKVEEIKAARIKRLEQAAEQAQRDLEIAMKSGPAWDDRLKA